jgi:hypothetical protein
MRKHYQRFIASTSKTTDSQSKIDENIGAGADLTVSPPESTLSPNNTTGTPIRDKIFVSYSHKDKWLFDQFKKMPTPAMRNGLVDFWDDSRIKPGARWKDEIQVALKSAKVGVLLVSNDFPESDFIVKHELPVLLKAARDEGATIFWMYLSHCYYELTEIEAFKAAHDVSRPLDGLTKPKRLEVLKKIAGDLIKLAQNPSTV